MTVCTSAFIHVYNRSKTDRSTIRFMYIVHVHAYTVLKFTNSFVTFTINSCLSFVYVIYLLSTEDAAAGNDDLDEDVAEALTEKESEIRSYLLHGEQLSEELLEELIEPFWKNEPYR